MRMLITTGMLILALGAQASAQTRSPVVVTCGPGQHAVVRDAFMNGSPVTRVECAGASYAPARAVSQTRVVSERRVVRPHRSWGKSALVIGGAAATGAGVGGLIHGGKGALIGAALGGGVGSLFEAAHRR